MYLADYLIFGIYFLIILGIGIYFYFRTQNREEYYVGGRKMSPSHIGMSIVATDVGGGFSIGLGGLGYVMGLSGSWLLFTGLIGAWLSAVLIIPKIKKIDAAQGMLTYPDFLRYKLGDKVALAAAVISGIGYLGFTAAQILAGAKLAAGSVFSNIQFADPVRFSLYLMALIVFCYTVLGGIKAVIYTDTVQWIVLLSGLAFFGVPFSIIKVGGWQALKAQLPADFFTLTNVSGIQLINWFFTIIPIWFIAMTLYQRIFACKNTKDAQRAFYIAGILEYPIMAFLGVILGMVSRVFFPAVEAEMGLPMLLRDVLPVGITGIVIAAYFSAIMSTADSCLIASSGNFVNDIIERYFIKNATDKKIMRISRVVTLIIGLITVIIASYYTTVLEIILHAYAFMVAGLFVPTLIAYFSEKPNPPAAFASIFSGGTVALLLIFTSIEPPWNLDSSVFGIATSLIIYIIIDTLSKNKKEQNLIMYDNIEKLLQSTIQHGKENSRIYLMKLSEYDMPGIMEKLDELAIENQYGKIFAKVPEWAIEEFSAHGFIEEANIPGFFNGVDSVAFMAKYPDQGRGKLEPEIQNEVMSNRAIALKQSTVSIIDHPENILFRKLTPEDSLLLAEVYKQVFESYPFPIFDPGYLKETMASHIIYFGAFYQGKLVAAASSEMDKSGQNAEMTDFATLPAFRGKKLALILLNLMESEMASLDMKTLYTIARAHSAGMNITFAKAGYNFCGTLINNTNIFGRIESMNVWYKPI